MRSSRVLTPNPSLALIANGSPPERAAAVLALRSASDPEAGRLLERHAGNVTAVAQAIKLQFPASTGTRRARQAQSLAGCRREGGNADSLRNRAFAGYASAIVIGHAF